MINRIFTNFIVTGLALLAAGYFIDNFTINLSNIPAFLALVAVFTAINLIIRPVIKVVLTPIIILTLGIFNLVISGAILYAVDIYSENLTINGSKALIYATIIITIFNIVFHVNQARSNRY